MSDPIQVTPPTGYVTFKRMVQISPFNTATAEIMLQIPTGEQWTDAEGNVNINAIIADAKPAFFAAKATVYEQLGIPFEVDGEIVVREILHQQLGAVEVTDAESRLLAETTAAAQQASTVTKPASSAGDPDPNGSKESWWEHMAANPKRWYDNRASKKSAKGPDFKFKGNGDVALWLTFNGKSQVPDGVVVPEPAAFT